MVDALPQALILTSIVISFAFSAFLLGCGFVVAKMERSHG
jgi:multisubunit Na+/H+ antiporter MnhC subunit